MQPTDHLPDLLDRMQRLVQAQSNDLLTQSDELYELTEHVAGVLTTAGIAWRQHEGKPDYAAALLILAEKIEAWRDKEDRERNRLTQLRLYGGPSMEDIRAALKDQPVLPVLLVETDEAANDTAVFYKCVRLAGARWGGTPDEDLRAVHSVGSLDSWYVVRTLSDEPSNTLGFWTRWGFHGEVLTGPSPMTREEAISELLDRWREHLEDKELDADARERAAGTPRPTAPSTSEMPTSTSSSDLPTVVAHFTHEGIALEERTEDGSTLIRPAPQEANPGGHYLIQRSADHYWYCYHRSTPAGDLYTATVRFIHRTNALHWLVSHVRDSRKAAAPTYQTTYNTTAPETPVSGEPPMELAAASEDAPTVPASVVPRHFTYDGMALEERLQEGRTIICPAAGEENPEGYYIRESHTTQAWHCYHYRRPDDTPVFDARFTERETALRWLVGIVRLHRTAPPSGTA